MNSREKICGLSFISETARGKLLHNKILSELEAMGLSISEQEKRQVLINILKDLC